MAFAAAPQSWRFAAIKAANSCDVPGCETTPMRWISACASGVFKPSLSVVVELAHDLIRRAGRRDDAEERRHVVIGNARLHHGRNIGRLRRAGLAGDGERTQPALAN